MRATTPELAIYDPRILGGPGLSFPRPVWRLEVSSDRSPVTVRDLVLVDADLGNVALSFSEIEGAKNRIVCNAKSEPKLVPCTEGLADLVEGDDPVSASAQVNAAYNLTGALYDFYKDHFGRDSIDNAGMPLVSTVNYCENTECPFENAFWNGEQMVYGAGMVTDDVTGHELTHGVNGSESNLFYYYQSGALDEALADIFGELFDLSTPDAPADRWKIGEDSAIGTIRNMADPPAFDQPDRTGSEEWFFNPNTDFEKGDNGGVHENSGVGGKAAFLITDGGSFNGQTVTGLGEEKTLQITYDVAADMLTSASDYQDYGNDLRQSCSDLVGEHEITAADCEQVEKTVLATEMETPPAEAAPATAGLCAQGGSPVPAFFDDIENPASGNWKVEPSEKESVFFFSQETAAELEFDATYAKSGSGNIWGFDAGEVSDSAIAMTKSVTVPGDGRMRFDHAHGFETGEGNDYDGGVIEYSTDGGAHWTDAGSLIEAGDRLRRDDLHRSREPALRPAGFRRRQHRLRLDPPQPLLAGRQTDPVPVPDRDRRSAGRLRLVHRRRRDLPLRRRTQSAPAAAPAGTADADSDADRQPGADRPGPGPIRRCLCRRPRRPGPRPGEGREAEEEAAGDAPADSFGAKGGPPRDGQRPPQARRRPQGLRRLTHNLARRSFRAPWMGGVPPPPPPLVLQNRDRAALARRPEIDPALAGREDRVVAPETGALAGAEAGAALADDDLAAGDALAGEHLDPEHLRVRVAAVAA